MRLFIWDDVSEKIFICYTAIYTIRGDAQEFGLEDKSKNVQWTFFSVNIDNFLCVDYNIEKLKYIRYSIC